MHVGYLDGSEVKWKVAEPMIGFVQLDDPPMSFSWWPSTPTRPVADNVVVEFQGAKGGAWFWTLINGVWSYYGEDSKAAFTVVGINMVP